VGLNVITSASPNVGSLGGAYSSIARDSGGNPVISHYDGGQLLLTACDDPACAPGGDTTNVVDSTANVGQFTSLALTTPGDLPVISYYDFDAGDLKVVRCNDPACGPGGEVITVADFTGDVGQYSSIALGALDVAAISYYDATNFHLKIARCPASGACTSTTVDGTGVDPGTGKFTSIEMSGTAPTVAYYDAENGVVRVKRCTALNPVLACPAGAGAPVATTVGLVEQNLSLALDGSGFPVISYYDNDVAVSLVSVAHCSTVDCTGAITNNALPDSANLTVFDPNYTSITLDGTDFPIVSYTDSSGGGLHIGRCFDADCATSVVFIPDASVGQYSSIVLDLAGNPTISSQDPVVGDLIVTHCGDPTCNPRRIRPITG
jgi:hypothetical protein